MTIPATGDIFHSEIQAEHGGTNPIWLSEYYRGSGIDSTRTQTVTGSSLSVANNGGFIAGWGACTINPSVNYGSYIYAHAKAADNGSTSYVESSFVVNLTGTYTFMFYHPHDSSGWQDYKVYRNGALVTSGRTIRLSSVNDQTILKLSFNAGDTIKVWTFADSPSGWSGNHCYVGGDNWNTRSLTTSANTTVPSDNGLSGAARTDLWESYFRGTTNY